MNRDAEVNSGTVPECLARYIRVHGVTMGLNEVFQKFRFSECSLKTDSFFNTIL